jgi:hypothetical protein
MMGIFAFLERHASLDVFTKLPRLFIDNLVKKDTLNSKQAQKTGLNAKQSKEHSRSSIH